MTNLATLAFYELPHYQLIPNSSIIPDYVKRNDIIRKWKYD